MEIANIELFIKRNLKKYVENHLFGVYSLLSAKKYDIRFYLKSLEVLFLFYFFKKIYIPQVEFFITTKCTLKCEQCSNYIPYISDKNNYEIDINDFKRQIENLTKNIFKLNSLILVGGEPLLHPNFLDLLKYSVSKKNIEKIYIYTNCTILFSEEQLSFISANKKKIHIYLSNYSRNKSLKNILKVDEIRQQLDKSFISYTFNEKLIWVKQEKIELKYRTKNEHINICQSCGVPSVSAVNGELHYCPKATAGKLLGSVPYSSTDFIDLNLEVTPKDIINFYSNNNFSICKYCSGTNVPVYLIKPAKQLED